MVRNSEKTVLVAVLKDKRDRELLLREKWYRIPMDYLPKRRFEYIAFYQPKGLETHGKLIEHYARIANWGVYPRVDLLPAEASHPKADKDYAKLVFDKIETLDAPIRNVIPRRVSFGFTTLEKLRSASDILELYGVRPTEQIIQRRLAKLGIIAKPQHNVTIDGKRFRIDLAIFTLGGQLAIECDNKKAHTGKAQFAKDASKDETLTRAGWKVIRLKEYDIIRHPKACIARIQQAIADL